MSVSSEIERIQGAKADIKAAIEEKGVTVGDGLLNTYAEKVAQITGGNNNYNSYFGAPSIEALESEANNYALWVKKFPAIDLSSLPIEPGEPLVLTNFFNYAGGLVEVELFDTSEVTNMESMFSYCTSLTTVPVFDMSVVEAVYDMFLECPNLSNDSLNNILRMCIDVGDNGVFTGEKVLATLGLFQEQIVACRNLSNYQEFIESGWEEGDNSPVS